MSEKEESVKSILSLTLICILVSFSVVLTYKFTKPYIERSANQAAYSALDSIFPNENSYSEINVRSEILEEYGCTFMRKADNSDAVAFQIETRGYQSGLAVMVGVANDGNVVGLKVVKHGETEGIGTRAMTEEYLSQYVDENNTQGVEIISGATYTSNGIKNAVDSALKLFDAIKEEIYG